MKTVQYTEKFFFILLGNFITSCYVKDFTLFELLRKPIYYPLNRQGNFFAAKIPKGLPWQETVFMLADVFVTKTKDVPVKKGLQSADKNYDFLLVDAVGIESLLPQKTLSEIKGGAVVYSPLYRFVTEPFVFNIQENASGYFSNALSYILRSEGIGNSSNVCENENYEIKIHGDLEKYPVMKILIVGKERLDRIELNGGGSDSCIDLASKKIIISKPHAPICFDALSKTGETDLQNVRFEKSEERIEVSYAS